MKQPDITFRKTATANSKNKHESRCRRIGSGEEEGTRIHSCRNIHAQSAVRFLLVAGER